MIKAEVAHTGIVEIADLPYYTEGPAVDKQGNIFFTTLTGGTICRIDGRGKMKQWAVSDCPNGQVILPDGEHLVCDSKAAAIRRFSADGQFIKDEVNGFCANTEVHTPNDLVAGTFGNVFFTDSARHTGKVFMLAGDGRQYILADMLDYPNGLVVSQDGKWLFVAESYQNRIIKIDITKPWQDGRDIRVVANLPRHTSGREQDNLPDGLTLDHDGNIWVAHYGMQSVHQYSPLGIHLSSVNTYLPLTSNLVFANRHALVVTGGFAEPGPGKVLKIFI